MKARSETKGLRKFVRPKGLNFSAENYTDLVNLDDICIIEPPLLHYYSEDKLKELVENVGLVFEDITQIPCHAQAVERCIRIVTKSSLAHSSDERRDGKIRATVASRQASSDLSTKKGQQSYPFS
ncbi:hypothetical protein TKK_0014570 [Trichogramma kaykai]